MNWPISWNDVKNHIDDMEDGIPPELLPQGGVGYSEPGKVFTYDGGEDGEFFNIAGLRVALLSADVFDLSKIKRIKCIFARTGQEFEFAEGDFELINFNGYKAVKVSLGNDSVPVVLAPESGGLLGYAQEGFGYCSYIEFAETVHPIDPKYLPGVCLPVVELSTVLSGGNSALTDEENVNLDEVYAKKVPIICNITAGDLLIDVSIPLMWASNYSYVSVTPFGEFSLAKTDSGWIANLA